MCVLDLNWAEPLHQAFKTITVDHTSTVFSISNPPSVFFSL